MKNKKFNVGDYVSCEIGGIKCVSKVIEVDEINKSYTLYAVEGTFANSPARYSGLSFSDSNKYTLEENYNAK